MMSRLTKNTTASYHAAVTELKDHDGLHLYRMRATATDPEIFPGGNKVIVYQDDIDDNGKVFNSTPVRAFDTMMAAIEFANDPDEYDVAAGEN